LPARLFWKPAADSGGAGWSDVEADRRCADPARAALLRRGGLSPPAPHGPDAGGLSRTALLQRRRDLIRTTDAAGAGAAPGGRGRGGTAAFLAEAPCRTRPKAPAL